MRARCHRFDVAGFSSWGHLDNLRRVGTVGIWLCLCLLATVDATAQPAQPIGPFVLDVRGALARLKEDAATAEAIGVQPANLPTRGLGLAVGAHWYPLGRGRVTLGLGGELLWARDTETAEPTTTGTTTTEGPVVTTRLSAMSPQLSLNFGHGDGWSYVSGGIGWARLTAERQDLPFTDGGGRARTTHYGGGARWFTGPHLAFTFDVRFYTINALPASGTRPDFPRSRFMVISVGTSFR
ncbi:MAG: hypothetical protein ACRD15_05690 [Vicinamibacterales bacterium]